MNIMLARGDTSAGPNGVDGRAMRFCEPHGGQVYVVMSYQYGMSMMGIFFFWDAHFTIHAR